MSKFLFISLILLSSPIWAGKSKPCDIQRIVRTYPKEESVAVRARLVDHFEVEEIMTILKGLNNINGPARNKFITAFRKGLRGKEDEAKSIYLSQVTDYVGRLSLISSKDREKLKQAKDELSNERLLKFLTNGNCRFSEYTELETYKFPHENNLLEMYNLAAEADMGEINRTVLSFEDLNSIIEMLNIPQSLKREIRDAIAFRKNQTDERNVGHELSQYLASLAGSGNHPLALEKVERSLRLNASAIRQGTDLVSSLNIDIRWTSPSD